MGINQLRLTTRDAGEIIIYLPVPEGEQLVIRSLRYFLGQKEWLEKRLEGSGIICEENPVTETEPGTIHPQEAKEQNPPENREVTVSYLERQGDREILSVENRGADKAVKSIAAEQYREGRWVKALPRDSGAEELLTYLYLEPGDRVWELHTGELLLEEEQKTRFIFYFEDGTAAWAEW